MITANAGLRLQRLRVTIADKNGNFTSTVINLGISLVQFQMIGAPRRLAAMAQSLQKITNTVVLVQGAFHLVQSVPVFGAWCIYSVAVMTCQLFADRVISTACCSLTQGMSEAKAADRLMLYGLNELTPPVTTSEWVKFGRTLVGGFALLLWAGSILCFGAFVIQWIKMNGNDVPQDNVSIVSLTAACFKQLDICILTCYCK